MDNFYFTLSKRTHTHTVKFDTQDWFYCSLLSSSSCTLCVFTYYFFVCVQSYFVVLYSKWEKYL